MHLKRIDLPRKVVHGFSGSLQQAQRFIELGYKVGVGTITYPRASKTRDVIAQLPLSALLLETDAPDRPLNGFSRGSRTARNRRHACLPRCVNCVRSRKRDCRCAAGKYSARCLASRYR